MKDLDFYKLELHKSNDEIYRFISLYNGTKGTWHRGKKGAIKDGERHKALVIALNAGTAAHESDIWNEAVKRVLDVYREDPVADVKEVIEYLLSEVYEIRNH